MLIKCTLSVKKKCVNFTIDTFLKFIFYWNNWKRNIRYKSAVINVFFLFYIIRRSQMNFSTWVVRVVQGMSAQKMYSENRLQLLGWSVAFTFTLTPFHESVHFPPLTYGLNSSVNRTCLPWMATILREWNWEAGNSKWLYLEMYINSQIM